jgi:two-component system, LuxR family, sensor kinase FixL
MGDRIQLQQVIVNLLVNSIQAIAHGATALRRIDLATERDETGKLVFTIRDTGPGISIDDVDRIFDSFFTTKDAGMGIGLAICQSIVTGHGGDIAVSSHSGGGATFRVSLPAWAGARAEPSQARHA